MSRNLRPYLEYQADRVEAVLAAHRAPGRVTGGTVGPQLVRFNVMPAPHIRVAAIEALKQDLALALSIPQLSITRDRGQVVLEFVRPDARPVSFDDLLAEVKPLPVGTMLLGLTADGAPLLARLSAPEVAHVLISGTTGAGKSVLMRAMALSMCLTNRPNLVGMLAIDPKNRAFPDYRWPHLVRPVITGAADMAEALRSMVRLMEMRDQRRVSTPQMAVFIDELADLVMTVEGATAMLTRLVQRGREAGIHVIAATQRPGAAILTTLMRANFPLRMVGKVVSAEDAYIASGRSGTNAHLLNGRGDFIAVHNEIIRFQVPLVTVNSFAEGIREIGGNGIILDSVPQTAPEPDRAETDARTLLAVAEKQGRRWQTAREAERWIFGENRGGAFWNRTTAAIAWINDNHPGATTTEIAPLFPGWNPPVAVTG